MQINYTAEPTLAAFHASDAFVRGVRGPIGTGKSVGMCIEVLAKAQAQPAWTDKVRRTRWAAIRNCFDDKTEILTEFRGFVLFKDLVPEDRVAQLSDAGELEYVRPRMYYAEHYAGDMLGFENEGVDFLVTPDHRLNVSKLETRKKVWSKYRFETAKKCYGNGGYRVSRNAHWAGVKPAESTDFYEWLGFWFAEGSAGAYQYADRKEPHWRCVITQTKQPEYVRDLFARAGVAFTESRDAGTVRYVARTTPAMKTLITELIATGKAVNKRVPERIKAAPPAHLAAFMKGYLAGDGTERKDCRCTTAGTSSRALADDLQEMALKAGMVVNITLKAAAGIPYDIKGVAGTTNSEHWTVTFVQRAKFSPALKAQGYAGKYKGWYVKPYDGMVYCVEVPTHRVYIRRGGKGHWSSQTYSELKSTTIRTWQDWVPGELAPVRFDTPISSRMITELPDGTTLDLEILFISCDRPEDVKKLKSLELTGVWMNECSELPKAILDMATGRVGRYPPKNQGGSTWSGVIMDTNSPDDDHWYYKLAEVDRPEGYEFFAQPPALIKTPTGYRPNPQAENVVNQSLGYEYWLRQVPGKDEHWIKVFLLGKYGTVHDGKPVYSEYNDTLHCRDLRSAQGQVLVVGIDFGLTPAAALTQTDARGRFFVLGECVSEDMDIREFLEFVLIPRLQSDYPEHWEKRDRMIRFVGDPAGEQRSQTDSKSCFDEFKAKGLRIYPAKSNAWLPRRGAVAWYLNRLSGGGPAFMLDPSCDVLRKGFNGGYKYHRLQVSGEERYTDEPVKNRYSHIHDALQYAAMETGGVQAVRKEGQAPTRVLPVFRPFDASMGALG